ncbi:MAG: pyridoxamine 5'-phosphate oxidase [Chloroflexi bacterium CFX4]|nr:pyridoxamine 5'-phosphate oxidase [Chloroflexi bacterium CFX4]MDL1924201.1 pyridoxamine 5'-phosphate oxidase [Chloroflexi bacterium CFX3]
MFQKEIHTMSERILPRRARPRMAASYGISADESGMLAWAWVEDQLSRARNYWLCTVRADGRPHATPIWAVWYEGALYWGADPNSVKARNFTARPAVSLHLESGDEVVILEGVVQRGTTEAIAAEVGQRYTAKYGLAEGNLPTADAYYWLKPKVGMAWHESAFPTTATRFLFEG